LDDDLTDHCMIPSSSQSLIARFAIRHGASIAFLVVAVSLAGAYAALHMPSAVFPETDFPRVVVIVQSGVMPADEMMATLTRPIEEAMKDIQGCQTVRSSTGRGTAEIDLFFSWNTDMRRAELDTQARLAQLRAQLPAAASTDVYRMTFSTFPILGLSLTGQGLSPTQRWEVARYQIKPRLLRIPGVSRVDLLGGPPPEYAVVVDPLRLAALKLDLMDVVNSLAKNNLVSPAGMHQQDNRLFLTAVDGRVHNVAEISSLTVSASGHPIPIGDFATVERTGEPSLYIASANGTEGVLLNIYSHPDASTLEIARQLQEMLPAIRHDLPPGLQLGFFYDQSLLVRASVKSVWDAILFGLVLSLLILYLFLRSWRLTGVAIVVIPVTVLATILSMKLFGLSFNLMTLGGIAAAIGLVIDDAIVVVEAIHAKAALGLGRTGAVIAAVTEILPPLVGSTLTPVVVFIPLAFLTGIAGVFFRALAITMVVALLVSLVLALMLTPALSAWTIGLFPASGGTQEAEQGGFIFRKILSLYERIVGVTLDYRWTTLGIALFVLFAAATGYTRLKSDFLPQMEEGGFIIDYIAPPGIGLEESNRQMLRAEEILRSEPEIESYSRRTGAALGVGLVEPNTGDFLLKLKANRARSSEAVIADLRVRLTQALPRVNWEFPGILTDLIGDLTLADEPIEIKIISTDPAFLKTTAQQVEEDIENIPGVVDVNDGLIYTGPTLSLRVRTADAERFGLSTESIGDELNAAILGKTASAVLEGDRLINIRVKARPEEIDRVEKIRQFPIRTPAGSIIQLDQVCDLVETPRQLELHRDDLRQIDSVTAELQGRDLGSAMQEIRAAISRDPAIPPSAIEFGGLYQQQQESFRNLTIVLLTALVLVFTVALLEFRSFYEPIAIVFGAALSVFGIVAALLITNTTLNIVTFLGAIIGMGIVHKNGLLMLDYVNQLRAQGVALRDALIRSGRRRLRPVLMTSLAAALGMLPLAWGFESADMLRPLAIAVIGAVCISVLMSLVATPVVYFLMENRSWRNMQTDRPV
jgi:CzcA family heavy metal efflux pump